MKYRLLITTSILSFISFCLFFQNPVSATSESIVISKVQTGGIASGTTLQEYVQIYNNSDEDINITNWCLQFSSDSNALTASYRDILCIVKSIPTIDYVLSSKHHALFASPSFVSSNSSLIPDMTFTNLTNIPGTNGTIRLLTDESVVIDQIGWGSGMAEGAGLQSLSGGNIFSRNITAGLYSDTDNNLSDFAVLASPSILEMGGMAELIVELDLCANLLGINAFVPEGYLVDEDGNCIVDACPNIPSLQTVVPEGYEKADPDGDCIILPLTNDVILVTEILPNAPGSDTGNEFIELYNPNQKNVNLKGYKIFVGPSFQKQFTIGDVNIAPKQYLVFSDAITGIVLPNTAGIGLRIVSPAGNVSSESGVYNNASDDASWALVEDQWIYTNQITPGLTNLPYLEPATVEVLGVTSVMAPCPQGKYRNLSTNRCRTIETAISSLTSCDEDQYRNIATNRCNKLAAASVVKPCAVGQERNPETNRCRKITSAKLGDESLATIADVKVDNTEGQINWYIIMVTLSSTLAYIIYEWRSEIKNRFRSFKMA